MTEWTSEAINRRLVRYADLQPCRTTFIDTKTSGSTEQENFAIIGSGVSESADQHVHICERHGFGIGGARQSFGCVNSQHSRHTAEIVVAHSGHWRLHFGPNKEDGSIDIAPGDVASVPIHIFRGFSKLDQGKGFLWMPFGINDPGKVTWAPALLETAADHDLKLARGGRLIDTSNGNYELKNVELEEALDKAGIAELKAPPVEKLLECVVRADAMVPNLLSPLASEGVEEAGVIVPRATSDGFSAGPIIGWWPQDLNLRRLTLQTGAYVPMHARREAEVLFVQAGILEVSWEDGALMMGGGDTLSVPVNLQHAFRNTASVPAVVFIVRGTDDPAMPVFASTPTVKSEVAAVQGFLA